MNSGNIIKTNQDFQNIVFENDQVAIFVYDDKRTFPMAMHTFPTVKRCEINLSHTKKNVLGDMQHAITGIPCMISFNTKLNTDKKSNVKRFIDKKSIYAFSF